MAIEFLNIDKYQRFVRIFSQLSGLFSDSKKPYIPYRFAEKLYCHCVLPPAWPEDLSRADNSFDCMVRKDDELIGVGIKTFVTSTTAYKDEKVAEFTKYAGTHNLGRYNTKDLVYTIANLRNKRVLSDANEYGINIDKSFYHCLVRDDIGFFIHEEPYSLVNTEKILPIDLKGNIIDEFLQPNGSMIPFTDGCHIYKFNTAKNTLYRRFAFNRYYNSPFYPVIINDDAFSTLLALEKELAIQPHVSVATNIKRDFIILPLYTKKIDENGLPIVATKSGINQWNAGGRKRTFGEAYIPIRSTIYDLAPNFFPFDNQGRPIPFKLRLPNGNMINAKICQEGNKALMSDPNTDLLQWLFTLIDGDFEVSKKRKSDIKNTPYTYEDLLSINKDSIAIFKDGVCFYSIKCMPLHSYEKFIELATSKGIDNINIDMITNIDTTDDTI